MTAGSRELDPAMTAEPALLQPSGQVEQTRQRILGAYYTPSDAAHFMAQWVLRSDGNRILEPSAGDGVFLDAIDRVARSRSWQVVSHAVEMDRPAFEAMRSRTLSATALEAVHSDFMLTDPTPVDAAIGNPPFVRVRNLKFQARDASLQVSKRHLGEQMDPAGSTWMPFVLHSANHLRPQGRLAFVLPYEMTYVRYARPLWRFLSEQFGSLRVVRVRERLFPDILQEVVLLFADRKGATTKSVRFEAYERFEDLVEERPAATAQIAIDDAVSTRPFVTALLPPALQEWLRERLPRVSEPASQSASFRIGYVSGDKTFFHPTIDTIDRFSLPAASLRAAVSNARSLKSQGLWTSGLDDRARTSLYLPEAQGLTTEDRAYVDYGESLGIDGRYKCRIRDPWYVIPGVRTPDVIVSVFSEAPLLLANDAGLAASNSLICGYLSGGTPDRFVLQWYTSLTLLGIELQVHALGGGVFVLVPREAAKIPIARPDFIDRADIEVVDDYLRAGEARKAYSAGDRSLVAKRGLNAAELDLIYEGIDRLSHWRTSAQG